LVPAGRPREGRPRVAVIRRKLTSNVRDQMTPGDRDKLERLIGRPEVSPAEADRQFHITAADVPDVLTRGLRERDGSVGRTILVYPNPAATWWRGETITTFVTELRAAAQAPVALGGRPRASRAGPRCRRTSSRRWSTTARWRRASRSRAWR
jgi:hypothetical protein